MLLLDTETLKEVRKELEKQDIKVDVNLDELAEILGYFNDGSDNDFIIDDESVEYYNLRVGEFKKIGNWDCGDVAYLHHYHFDSFCILADDYDTLSEFYKDYRGE